MPLRDHLEVTPGLISRPQAKDMNRLFQEFLYWLNLRVMAPLELRPTAGGPTIMLQDGDIVFQDDIFNIAPLQPGPDPDPCCGETWPVPPTAGFSGLIQPNAQAPGLFSGCDDCCESAWPVIQTIPQFGTGSGTVTSIAITGPSSFISWSGSPITTSGTLTGTLANQTANFVLAGPTSGGATTPTFRALVSADLPASITASTLACTDGSGTTTYNSSGVSFGSINAAAAREITWSSGINNYTLQFKASTADVLLSVGQTVPVSFELADGNGSTVTIATGGSGVASYGSSNVSFGSGAGLAAFGQAGIKFGTATGQSTTLAAGQTGTFTNGVLTAVSGSAVGSIVTAVTMDATSGLTNEGTATAPEVGFSSQSANTALWGPVSGAAAVPAFRKQQPADAPFSALMAFERYF